MAITVKRTFGTNYQEERFYIYEGSETTGTPVFSMIDATSPNTLTEEVCLNPVLHTVHLNDNLGDGWDLSSHAILFYSGIEYVSYHLASGSNDYKTLEFNNLFSYNGPWKHSNQAQVGTTWTTQTVTWTEGSSFPEVTTTTRYFRRTLALSDFLAVYYAYISIKTNTGFLMYINGQLVWNWNMPTGNITADTYALSKVETITERSFGTMLKLWATSATIEIAIEVHATADTISGEESFNCQIICKSGSDFRRIDNAGTVSSSPSTSGNEGSAMIYDNSVNTKWCFPHYSGSIWTTWTFSNGRRETINKYQIATANDFPARDPVTWKVYGSMDGVTFYLLDSRSQISWTSRFEIQTFTMNNIIPFNSYKLEVTAKAGVNTHMQFSEWNLLASPAIVSEISLSYPESIFALGVNVDTVDVQPTITGFFDFSISGSLPAGLTFDPSSGRISGTPTTALASTSYTISGVFLLNTQTYTTVLTFTVSDCTLPTHIFASFSKTNGDNSQESFQVVTSNSHIVLNGVSGSQSTMVYNVCLPVGIYTLKMLSSAGTLWSTSSFLTINYVFGETSFTIARTRLNTNTEKTFDLVVDYALPFASANTAIKFLADNTVPANWYSTNFVDSSWTTLVDASRPSITQKIQLYRSTFTITSITGYNGYELNVKAQAGVVVYVNGNEIYRRALPAGDLTPSTSATAGAEAATWRTITGKISHLNAGSNTLAVGIVRVSDASAPIDFDVSLRLMKEINITPRYWNIETTANSGTASNAFDLNPSTTWRASLTQDTHVSVQFNDRAEFVTRYCFNTNSNNADEDPLSWSIKGSNDGTNWDTLKTETNVLFEMRATEYCFFMPTVTKAYSYLRFQPTAVASSSSQNVAIGDLLFFLENLDGVTVPDLAFEPNILVGYTGSAFPEVTANSPYYTTFTITPALPSTLVMSSNTGSIKGVPTQPYSTTIHTISAINHLGETKSTTVSVTVNICAGELVSFSLEFFLESGANKCSFNLKDLTTSEIIESRSSMIEYQTFTIPMCRSAGKYGLILKKTDKTGWGSNRVTVRLADGSELLTESLAAGQTEKQYNFNVRYEVAPLFTEWNYLVDGTAAPSGWNTVAGAPSSWQKAMPGSFPVATGITQYYYKKFTSGDLNEFSVLEVSVTTIAGMVVYLNGVMINSMNIDTMDITSETVATNQLDVATPFIIGVNVLSGYLVEGENILAVEMHRHTTNEEFNTFDASAILVLDNMIMMKDGIGTTNPPSSGNQGSDKAFDNNSDTKFYVAGQCVGVTLNWMFNNNRKEPITNYGLINAEDCNNRHPSSWTLHASNDGTNWDIIHTAENAFFTEFHQQKRFSFYNGHAYNQYKVTVTACNNPTIPCSSNCGWGSSFQIADFFLFAKRVDPDCPRDGEYPPAMIGAYSYAPCSELYMGTRRKMCTAEGFDEEWNGCIPKVPRSIKYNEFSYVFTQGKQITPITPMIVGAEVTVSVFPILPMGMMIDSTTGVISGIPTELKQTEYVVTAQNKAGSTQTVIYISIVEPPANHTFITMLVSLFVVFVFGVCIAFVIVLRNRKLMKSRNVRKGAKTKTITPTTTPRTPKEITI